MVSFVTIQTEPKVRCAVCDSTSLAESSRNECTSAAKGKVFSTFVFSFFVRKANK